MILLMALFLFFQFGLIEIATGPWKFADQLLLETLKQCFVATQVASFDQVGGDSDIVRSLHKAIGDAAYRMTNIEVQIPEKGEKSG